MVADQPGLQVGTRFGAALLFGGGCPSQAPSARTVRDPPRLQPMRTLLPPVPQGYSFMQLDFRLLGAAGVPPAVVARMRRGELRVSTESDREEAALLDRCLPSAQISLSRDLLRLSAEAQRVDATYLVGRFEGRRVLRCLAERAAAWLSGTPSLAGCPAGAARPRLR